MGWSSWTKYRCDGLHGRNIDGMVFMDVVKMWDDLHGRSIDVGWSSWT